jgi:hypothetical protein
MCERKAMSAAFGRRTRGDDERPAQSPEKGWQFVDMRSQTVETQLEEIRQLTQTQRAFQIVRGKNHAHQTWPGCCFDRS